MSGTANNNSLNGSSSNTKRLSNSGSATSFKESGDPFKTSNYTTHLRRPSNISPLDSTYALLNNSRNKASPRTPLSTSNGGLGVAPLTKTTTNGSIGSSNGSFTNSNLVGSDPLTFKNYRHSFSNVSTPTSSSTASARLLSSGEIIDIMEKEQDAIVLKLIKEINNLKDENRMLKSQINNSRGYRKSFGSINDYRFESPFEDSDYSNEDEGGGGSGGTANSRNLDFNLRSTTNSNSSTIGGTPLRNSRVLTDSNNVGKNTRKRHASNDVDDEKLLGKMGPENHANNSRINVI